MKDKFAWGFRVQPSYEELLESTRKRIRLHQPDRSAKWFALSPYRAFMLDQAKKYNDYEHLKLDYNESGASLPARAAAVQQSAAGDDDAFWRQQEQSDGMDAEEARQLAEEAYAKERMREAREARAQNMLSYTQGQGHWSIITHQDELDEAGVFYSPPPSPRVSARPASLPAPVSTPVAAGQLGGANLPSLEILNHQQPRSLTFAQWNGGGGSSGSSSSYELMRSDALGR